MKKQRGMTRRERKRFRELERRRIDTPLTREQIRAIQESLKEQAELLGLLLPPIFIAKMPPARPIPKVDEDVDFELAAMGRWPIRKVTMEELRVMYPDKEDDT